MPKVISLSILLISKYFLWPECFCRGEGWRTRVLAGRFLDHLIKYGFLHKCFQGFG